LSDIGLIGELAVELKLAEAGWHPTRLDTRRAAANADLLAVSGKQRVAIQVKTTKGFGHSHCNDLGLGYTTGYVGGGSFFNSKEGPLVSDVVVGVSYEPGASRFVVMPVAFAEALCRFHCDYWRATPTRDGSDTGTRSASFPLYIAFKKVRRTHTEHHSALQRNLLAFEDRWEMLAEPVDRLHDPSAWPLLD
jgi:hypothetical protein